MKPRFQLLTGPRADAGSSPPALAVDGLGKVFPSSGPLPVLQDISFTAAPGELICLLGPSGCGKTTLLNIIAGFTPGSSGTLSVHGRPVTRPGPDRCVVFQEDALFPWLTVAENIAFGLKGRTRDRRRIRTEVDRFLALVGLQAFRDYLPRAISGCMKQRVALARVLILNPRVLLMDEPFGALDAQTREEMQNLLLSLWHTFDHTILFVTHDITEAITLADRILVLDRHPGRLRRAVDVPLARPRKKESDAFHHFYRRLRTMLQN
jgi:NitT/TauT family transport system ATP-binding protein